METFWDPDFKTLTYILRVKSLKDWVQHCRELQNLQIFEWVFKRSSCQSAVFDRLPQFCHLIVGVRLSAKHSGKQMSNSDRVSMGAVKWNFNPHLGRARTGAQVYSGPDPGAGKRPWNSVEARMRAPLQSLQKRSGANAQCRPGGRTLVRIPPPSPPLPSSLTSFPPRLWQSCRSWRPEAD